MLKSNREMGLSTGEMRLKGKEQNRTWKMEGHEEAAAEAVVSEVWWHSEHFTFSLEELSHCMWYKGKSKSSIIVYNYFYIAHADPCSTC